MDRIVRRASGDDGGDDSEEWERSKHGGELDLGVFNRQFSDEKPWSTKVNDGADLDWRVNVQVFAVKIGEAIAPFAINQVGKNSANPHDRKFFSSVTAWYNSMQRGFAYWHGERFDAPMDRNRYSSDCITMPLKGLIGNIEEALEMNSFGSRRLLSSQVNEEASRALQILQGLEVAWHASPYFGDL